MKLSPLPDDFEIAPGHSVSGWKSLTLNDADRMTIDWNKALSILDARIRSRFIEPAQLLIDAETNQKRGSNGFAILAIDFLLIEAIQGFRQGLTNHNRQSKALFSAFLTNWQAFLDCVPHGSDAGVLANNVYEQGRCALHHTGSTDRVLVRRSGHMFIFYSDGRIAINRTVLHKELKTAFDAYIVELRLPGNATLRRNFKKKMEHICS